MVEKSESAPLEVSLNTPSAVYQPGQARVAASAVSGRLRERTGLLSQPALLAGASLILGLVFWLRLQNLMVSEWGYDQGYYLLVAHLMARGFAPYQEIYMSEPPGMVWSGYLPLQFFGSIWGMRFAMLCYTLLAVAATISLGSKLGGHLAGWLAGALLIFHNEFFGLTVDPGLPAISLALVALGLALRYRSTRKPGWLGVSALAMAGSFLLKLYMLPVAALVILMIYLAQAGLPLALGRRQFLRHALFWMGLMGLVILGVYLSYGLPTLLDQTIFFHLHKSEANPWSPWANLASIWTWLLARPLFLAVSLYSLGLAWLQRRRFGWMILAWLLLALLYLMVLNPLRTKHLFMLIPLQVIMIGLALSHSLNFNAAGRWLTWGVRSAGLVLTVWLFGQIFFAFGPLVKPPIPMVSESKQPIVEALTKFTTPTDCAVTDDPYIALVSGRLPPPWFANLSYARFESGSLDSDELRRITNIYNCQVVAPTFERLKNSSRPYYDWAKNEYLRTWVVDGKEIMLGKALAEAKPMSPISAQFGDQVTLLGLDWTASKTPADRHAYLSLYWQTLKPFSQTFKIFVQVRDTAGQTLISADHEVFDGLLPSQAWPVGRILKDTHRLPLSGDTPAGQYTLYIGLYDPATLERLPVTNDSSGENAAVFPGIILP
jgi:hypothetical protein